MLKKFLALAFAAALFGCAARETASDRKYDGGLSKEAMLERSEVVSNVLYELSLDLTQEQDYSGTSVIKFDLKEPRDLRVDFAKGKIGKVLANGRPVKVKYNGHFLLVPKENLVRGRNSLAISYGHDYSKNGEGFFRFVDPKDGRAYVYTDFEPYNANRFFPCFDQPNLKARYMLKVKAPANWTVITYDRETKTAALKGKERRNKVWSFPLSAPFSTYILNLTAGPYAVWESSFKGEDKNIPLRLFARQSLKKHVEHREWFDVTKQGLGFFEDYFDYPYPFNKLDQMIVPDFNWGGMENVGAITYSERFVHKSAPTIAQREGRANVIMHELAHQWFGNLVTMDWWNGLWLNESFATMMAHVALYEATEFKKAWRTFFDRTKNWAYWTDQLVTTHPIETPVEDTDTAFSNFDGITYGKGASALKQLRYYLGDDFKAGIRRYFKKHAYKNTQLEDFFVAMEKASNKDLDGWLELWLKKAGLNTLQADFECSEGKIAKFKLLQGAPEDHDHIRAHKTLVGLYRKEGGKLRLYKTQEAVYDQRTNAVDSLVGEACPDLVYPNQDDYDYVKVLLDPASLQSAKETVVSADNPFVRSMIWSSLWDMVRDAKWPVDAYAELAFQALEKENDYNIKLQLLRPLYGAAKKYRFHAGGYEDYADRLEETAYKSLVSARAGSDLQKDWFGRYVQSARSPRHLKVLWGALHGKNPFKGLEIDEDRKWAMIVALSEKAYPGAFKFAQEEAKKDNTERAKKSLISADAARPVKSVKTKWFNEVSDPESKLKLSRLNAAMRGMFPLEQQRFKKMFADDFYTVLPKLVEGRENHFLGTFARAMVPVFCSKQSGEVLRDYIDNHKSELPYPVVKSLRISLQENGRCVKIVQRYKDSR